MKLSVIIPTYNRFEMLLKSAASVCQVAHRPLEVIVVDDGSKDGTTERSAEIKAICESAGTEFQFIRQNNAGAATARNTGWEHASGDLIQWVDSDDTVVPEGVDALVAELTRDGDIDLAYGLVRIVDAEGRSTRSMGKSPAGWEADYFDYLWHTMAAVYRRSALEKVGRWNPILTMPDDWEFSSRVRIAGCRHRFVDVVVGNYVHHGVDTLTTTRFDAAKCYNVIEATLSLRDAFTKAGSYTPYIQQRCFNRVFVHALELASKKSELSREAFARCREIGSPNFCLRVLSSCMNLLPSCFVHRELFLLLRKDGDGTLRSMLQSSSTQSKAPAPQQPKQFVRGGSAAGAVISNVRLTAICPTYNRSSLVVEAISSFLSKSPQDWEMIVVDDGSIDNTIREVEALQSSLFANSLRLIKQTKNSGAPKARNVGLAAARGHYIMFVDSDDLVRPDGVAQLVEVLEQGDADYAYGIVQKTLGPENETQFLGVLGSRWNGDSNAVVDLNWHTMGAVYRKEFVLQSVGPWNEELVGSQDWEFQARVKLSGGKGVFVDVLVGDWRQDAVNRIGKAEYSRDYCKSVLAAALAIEREAVDAGRSSTMLKRRLSHRLIHHALETSAHGDKDLGREMAAHARRLGPGLAGRFAVSAFAIVPDGKWTMPLFRAVRRWTGL